MKIYKNIKNRMIWALLLSLVLYFGCSKQQETGNLTEDVLKFQTETPVMKFIETDEFLDIPRTKEELKRGDITGYSDEEIAKIKAALYRFYSNVELGENGRYTVNVAAGEDIRISDEIFSIFKENIDSINAMLDDAAKSGVEYGTPEITKEYLESLLR